MFTSQRMNSTAEAETKGNYKMSHSLSMDDTRKNSPKKDNIILGSMMNLLGSVGNIVSKIQNFMGNIDNTLSVTVVPNEGIISPEYILKNLTVSSEHLAMEKTQAPMALFERMPDERIYNTKQRIVDILASEIAGKSTSHTFIENETITSNTVTWFERYQEPQPSDYDRAIAESLKFMEDKKKKESEIEFKGTIDNYKNTEFCTDRMEAKKAEEMFTKIETKVPDSRQESPDSELLAKKCLVTRSRRKCNIVARMRGKGRGRPQLRRSGVSQTKHRKERNRHNLYSNIQDDLEAWKEETNESDDDTDCKSSSGIETESQSQDSYQIIPNYPMFVETFILGEPPRSEKWKQKKSNDSYKVRFLPDCEDENSSIPFEIRRRLQSESSIDSEDSCIVFEEGSESEYDDDDDDDDSNSGSSFYESSSDEEIEEDGNSSHKVRFDLQPKVHTMIQWDFAYRAARRGPWEQMARDRDRFRGRINCIGRSLDPILTAKHRDCIWRDRFASEN